MKNFIFGLLIAIGMVFIPILSHSQTITTSLKTTVLCPGEPLTVDYSITGTFDPLNTFTVQISDATGSFKTFLNIGSDIHKTASGSVVVTTPIDLPPGTKYRIRVIGSSPLTGGNDNGTDLTVGAVPKATFGMSKQNILLDDPVTFSFQGEGASTFSWSFGEGATPQTFDGQTPPPVTYSTPGAKTIILTVTSPTGCTVTMARRPDTYRQDLSNIDTTYSNNKSTLAVLSCSPAIPHAALAGQSDKQVDGLYDAGWIWLQPGVTYYNNGGAFQTVFAESGSQVFGGVVPMTVYLKSGASFIGRGAVGGRDCIVREPGSSVSKLTNEKILECSSLSFDYSNAPQITAGVSASPRLIATPVYPNPASSELNVTASESLKEIWLTNDLGQASLIETGKFLRIVTLNIGEFANGSYNLLLKYTDHTEVQRVIIAH